MPTGSWGKRSPMDYINEYPTAYGDNDNYKAYIFPPGKRRYVFCIFLSSPLSLHFFIYYYLFSYSYRYEYGNIHDDYRVPDVDKVACVPQTPVAAAVTPIHACTRSQQVYDVSIG